MASLTKTRYLKWAKTFSRFQVRGGIHDPRIIACGLAVCCMFVDDLPEAGYNTFHDPGTAAILSVILADTFTVLGRRISNTMIRWMLGPLFLCGLFFKLLIQSFFWIQNAGMWVYGTLIVTHILLGLVAARKEPMEIRLAMFRVSLIAVCGAIMATLLVSLVGIFFSPLVTDWLVFGATRVAIPWAFWTGVLYVENRRRDRA
jgi:hypothetical protein